MKLRMVSLTLAMLMVFAAVPAAYSEADAFAAALEARFTQPGIEKRTEVRWWMAEGAHTDETLLEEVQAMYDAGFRGMELCEQVDTSVDDADYGYGSDQWDHDLKLVLNKALDLGMTVSLTSGTNWATANIPGLDPQSRAASQAVFEIDEYLKAGKTRSGAIPMEKKLGVKKIPVEPTAKLIGVYAYRQTSDKKAVPVRLSPDFIDLTEELKQDENGVFTLDFTPPDPDSVWRVFYYWQQGAAQASSPAVEPAYCINYFDEAGVQALREYWEAHILDDEALNAKIQAGDVQVFMDSLEINPGSGFTFWADDMAEEFTARKGYDIRPYLYLFIDLPDITFFEHDTFGAYRMEGDEADSVRVMNDLFDVQTQLYMERMLTPLRDWLHEMGIATRAQISYGQRLEMSEPIQAVDFPEAENLNQDNQPDIYRLWTGGAKLQNKILSSETGAVGGMNYQYQDHLMEAYDLFAAGFNRIIWHIWSAKFGPGEPEWPGYRVPGVVFRSFYPFSTREPSARDYPLFNDHLGRIQDFLRTGKSRTDVGMLFLAYDQGMPSNGNHGGVNWLLNHEPALFPTTALQDAGYTYDYFSPDFLTAEGVSYDAERKTLEQAGYKALVVWQDILPLSGAKALLSLAETGMPVIIVDGAASRSPYRADDESEWNETIAALKALPAVVEAADAEAVLPALRSMNIAPYAGFMEPNHQLLTQARQDEEALYLYVYNYCDGTYQAHWSNGEQQDDHGTAITTEIVADGTFIPYEVNAWSGKTAKLGLYRHEEGKTIFPISLNYHNVALYALKPCEADSELHAVQADGLRVVSENGALSFRAVESGEYTVTLSDGRTETFTLDISASRPITGWNIQVETWTAGEERDTRTETLFGKTITESAVQTVRTVIPVELDTLTAWDEMPGVGDSAVGQAHYEARFDWDGQASGAYIDFGEVTESMRVTLNGREVTGVSMTDGRVDVGPWLVTGENLLEIEYSTNLGNALGSSAPAGWYGYHEGKQPYGPRQAILIPYINAEIQ